MRRIFLYFLSLLFLAFPAFGQSSGYKSWSDYKPGVSDPDAWYVVGGGRDTTDLIRPSSISRRGDFVEYWAKAVFDKNEEEIFKSKEEVNCSNETYRTVALTLYWEYETTNPGVRLVRKLPSVRIYNWPDEEFTPISPDSVIERKMRAACGLRP